VEAKSVFRPDQPGNAHKPATGPRNGEPVIPKSVHSAFIGTDLQDRLDRSGSETLVIAGIQTNYCVATTARMAGNLGYDTFVVGDACRTFDQRLLDGSVVPAQMAHDLALAELHGEFATVVSTADVLAALRPA
jgi:nicotinamidase-related amidase